MLNARGWICVAVLALAACGRAEERKPETNELATTVPAPGTGPDAKTPLGPTKPADRTFAEPNGPIDPKSGQGARAVVEQFCEMLKDGRYDAAHRFWSGDALADTEFARHWAGYGKLEGCAIDDAGPLEGAAGSIYTSVPAEFFFKGGLVKMSGSLTLRRINDVPGSTDEQRRWHIVKADLRPVD